MSIRALAIVTIASFVLLHPATGAAQDAITQAKALYASADYEQALKLLEGVKSERESYLLPGALPDRARTQRCGTGAD